MMTMQSPTPVLPPLPVHDGVEYRHVPGFVGYCAGTDGSIWSARVPNKMQPTFADAWTRKSVWKNADGYLRCCLVGNDGQERRKLAHTVILEAFIGPRPKGYDALHGNGVPSDNHLSNLRWGTRKENVEDARRHGTIAKRERNGQAKLSELRVSALKVLSRSGWTQRDLAALFGVSQPTISAVQSGKRWEDTNADA